MKRKVELEKLNILYAANEKLKGTDNYIKYHMCYETKMPNGSWAFCGWCVPSLNPDYIEDCYIKTFKSKEYLYIEYRNGPDRWTLKDSVKELLKL